MNTYDKGFLQEIRWCARWWWRLERRRKQGLAIVGFFLLLWLLLGGLAQRREPFSEPVLRFLFWLMYFFGLFLAIPRLLLERRPEEWRWLYSLVSERGGLGGLWGYVLSLTLGIGAGLWMGSAVFWGYQPPFLQVEVGGAVLAVPLLISSFLTARAEAAYALAAILAFPLCLFPLLWLTLRAQAPLLPLGGLFLLETLLYFLLGSYVWRE